MTCTILTIHCQYYLYLYCQIDYPEIVETIAPRHRFMSAYEQRVEPPDRKWQYLLFAAEPYETISFKVKYFVNFSDYVNIELCR